MIFVALTVFIAFAVLGVYNINKATNDTAGTRANFILAAICLLATGASLNWLVTLIGL